MARCEQYFCASWGDMIFFFNDTATTEIYTLSLHDALPICPDVPRLMREKGLNAYYGAKWSDWGAEVMNSVGCSDCHDARTMDLRPARPALYEAWEIGRAHV